MYRLPSFTIWRWVCVFLITHDIAIAGGHGHGAEEALATQDLEDVGLFCGAILFFSFLFCMTNKQFSTAFTINKTWGWMATTLSIFLAVLVWAWYNFLVILSAKAEHKAKLTETSTMALELFGYASIAFIMFVAFYVFVVSFTGPCFRNAIPQLLAFVAVWSHVVGFALMNVVAYLQDYFVALVGAEDNYAVFGAACAVWAAAFVASYMFMYVVYNTILATCVTEEIVGDDVYEEFESELSSEEDEASPGHKHKHQHHHHKDLRMTNSKEGYKVELAFDLVKAHLREFSSEASALALSYTFMRAICGMITGELPEVMQASSHSKTWQQRWTLWGIAAVSMLVAAVWKSYDQVVLHHCHRLRNIGKLFITQISTFLTAFLILQALRWEMYENDKDHKHNLFRHITMALSTSYVGLGLNLLWCEPCRCEFEREVATIMAVLAAFTWELCLDMMLEQVSEYVSLLKLSNDRAARHIVDSCVILVLIVVLTPMFICGVYPEFTVRKSTMTSKELDSEISESESEEEHIE